MEDELVLNTKEVACFLNCSVSCIRRLVQNKKLPCFKVGSKLYFNLTSVKNWSAKNGKK